MRCTPRLGGTGERGIASLDRVLADKASQRRSSMWKFPSTFAHARTPGMDCLRLLGQDQWALHVPLGKLHTERLVPVDDDARTMIRRILTLRTNSVDSKLANSATYLLPRSQSRARVYHCLSYALSCAAERAGCSHHVTCHQLRHSYATEMVRLGSVSRG
jgi:site-specific recombinase XerC